MKEKTVLMDGNYLSRALKRIAHEIVEDNKGTDNLVLVGIVTRGAPMAKMLAENINLFENTQVNVGSIDISLYRDDITELSPAPIVNATDINFEIAGKNVVLCDDVIFTGRTVRAAIDALLKLGRPKCIKLAVLVDRGHRELPIRADFVGKNVPTSLTEMISVNFLQTDGELNVKLYDLND